MKALALIEAVNHVCYRYRIEAFAWALAQRGLELEAVPLQRSPLRRIRQLRDTAGAGVVILQRKLLPLWQLCLLRHFAGCLIYDVDDAVFQRDSYHPKPADSWQRLARFWATVYSANAVIVGNDFLKEQVGNYIETERVQRIPTCLETDRYRLARHHRSGSEVRLVWIGQQSNLSSFAYARSRLAAIAGCFPGLELRVICDASVAIPGLRVVPRPWSSASEAAELAQADIGVCWLPDDRWSRGKCGLKVLQYMAAGLPVIANPVGVHKEMIAHGQTGFLAESPREWASAVQKLAADPLLRTRMGAAGRKVVEERFSVSSWGPRFASLIEQAARGAGFVAGSARSGIQIDQRDMPQGSQQLPGREARDTSGRRSSQIPLRT